MTSGLKERLRPYYLKWIFFPLFPHRRPTYFVDCWKYPSPGPRPATARAPEFLFLPMTDWHTRLQRTQHLALALARLGHPCSYLNPHLGREFPSTTLMSRGPVVTQPAPGVREIHVHLASEPVFHHRMLRRAENRFLAGSLDRAFADTPRPVVQVLSIPVWLDAAMDLRNRRGSPIVYDCHDLLSGFRSIGRDIVGAERELFRLSDLIVFSSRRLMSTWTGALPEIAGRSVLLRNAVDESWSAAAAPTEHEGTTIGYAGALDFWFDTAAVESAALRHPEWRFVLAGRIEDERVLALRKLANITLLGEVPHRDLPGIMAGFDVALIPFELNELTRCADPIKLYEYFSFGLPVVASELPELEPFRHLLYPAGSREAFVTQLESAVCEDDEEKRSERRRIAQRETWSARAEDLRTAVGRLTAAGRAR